MYLSKRNKLNDLLYISISENVFTGKIVHVCFVYLAEEMKQ